MSTFVFNLSDPDPALYSMTDGIVRPNRIAPIQEAIDLAEQDVFWAARGKAIQGYAQVENSLCNLFAGLGDMERKTAIIIFFRIASTDSRTKIIEKLLRAKHGNKLNLFWNPLAKEIDKLGKKRNEIAHWLAAANIILDGKNIMHVGVMLVHPGSEDMGKGDNSQRLLTKELIEYEQKCDEFVRLITMFNLALNSSAQLEDGLQTWLDIFQQPLLYPLPESHPLKRSQQAHGIPPQSSQG